MLKYIGLFFSIHILLASSCKNEKRITACIGYVEMPKLMKDYFLFKDSSYWIYVDSISGAIDSMFISDFRKEDLWPYKVVGTKDCPCYESYYYNINSINLDVQRVKIQSIFSKNPINLSKEKFTYNITLANSSKTESRFVTRGYDSIHSETPVIGGYIFKLSSFIVRGTEYNETLHLFYPAFNPYDWVKEIYYSRNIGISKFRDYAGHVWELDRFKIKQ